MSEFKKEEEGLDVYLVELDIIGIKGKVFMEIPAENEEEAWRSALMDISDLRENDCGVESISQVLK